MTYYTVTFQPGSKKVRVKRGETLLAAALDAGIVMNSACGGQGLCGKCRVIVKKGAVIARPSGHVTSGEIKKGVVLACEATVQGNAEVRIAQSSRVENDREKRPRPEVEEISPVAPNGPGLTAMDFPLVKKIYAELPQPSLNDNISDLDRIYRELEPGHGSVLFTANLSQVKQLGALLRENDFKVTVSLVDKDASSEIISIEPNTCSNENYGMAFDIGTTTVTGQLVNLATGKVIATAIAYNKQISFGSDVITRIVYASDAQGLQKLNRAILANIDEIIRDLCREHDIRVSDIMAVMIGGNTTMMHLLLNIDPTFIRREPYVPTTNMIDIVRASELGIHINPNGVSACVPGVSTYIGPDITAGILSSGLADSQDVSLLVDIGTNSEVVLGNREWMVGCSASAGPAFEGSGVTCGLRAISGAIEKVSIGSGETVRVKTIGDKPPKGICGSGYISLLREMFTHGLIDRDGRIRSDKKTKRVRKTKSGVEYVVVYKKDADATRDIAITDADIDNLKRSKGAIYSALVTLVKKMELTFDSVTRIYIAGGFGTYLDIASAVSIGLLPDIERSRYSFIGNSSLAGVRRCLFSRQARRSVKEIAKKVTYIDLSTEAKYMDEYIASLFFPHTDLTRFPSVGRGTEQGRG